MPNPTISMSEEMQERIHAQLEYSDSKSQWVRNAIELRFAVDGALGKIDDESEYGERIQQVVSELED